MRASVHANNSSHQKRYAAAISAGLRRHGVEVTAGHFDTPHGNVDFAVIWGGRQQQIMSSGRPYLLMERGHVGCPPVIRTHSSSFDASNLPWIAMAWNGLGGHGRIPECQDYGGRWRAHHGHLMQPWRCGSVGYALVIGQVSGDASIKDIDFRDWRRLVATSLSADGYRVLYRPHPISLSRGDRSRPLGSELTPDGASLADDLAGAAVVVTYNSGAAVDSVLAGIPTIAQDPGSMAWAVTSHSLGDPLVMPDRDQWAYRLAWCQWTMDEIERGEFWGAYCPMISRG